MLFAASFFLVIGLSIYFGFFPRIIRVRNIIPAAEVLEFAEPGKDVPFSVRPIVAGGPDQPPRFTISSQGESTHTVYPIFYGTDRLRNHYWQGLAFGQTVMLFSTWLAACISAIVLWPRTHRRFVRVIGTILLLGSLGLGSYLGLSLYLSRAKPIATRAFGTDRAELTLGVCTVSVPRNHVPGALESPSLMALEFRPEPDKHIVLHRVDYMKPNRFRIELAKANQDFGTRQALVFIHGYCNSFEDAARRTAQLVHDLGFVGIGAFYSWPSEAAFPAYTWDEQSVRTATPNLKAFLETLARDGGLERIHVIAHSMGNRCAIEAIAGGLDLGDCRIDQCVLAAADVDRQEFLDSFGMKVIKKVGRTTLYASRKDKALLMSWGAHKFSRLGDAREPIGVLDGLDSIDASELDTDFTSHDYFASNKAMVSELRQLINERLPVAKRNGMTAVPVTPLTNYWIYRSDP